VPEQGIGNAMHVRPSPDSGLNRNVVMATDGVPKKPRTYLYECAFVISCDEFIVMPVSIMSCCGFLSEGGLDPCRLLYLFLSVFKMDLMRKLAPSSAWSCSKSIFL
jgi:hypothetical protein